MGRRDKKTRTRATFSEETMREAVRRVRDRESLRKISEVYNISKSTLQRYVQKTKITSQDNISYTPNYSVRKIFTTEEEKSLEAYIIDCSKMNFGLTRRNIKQLAYELGMKNNKPLPQNWIVGKIAGEEWLIGFMKRHSSLSLRQPESCSLGRATAFNKHNVLLFFEKLKEVYARHPSFSDGSRVYNLDETATTTVIQKPQKVVAQKGMRQVSQVSSAERGTLVTTCCIVNAHGSCLPPAMVFPRVNFKSHMINDAPPGTLGLATHSGWMNSELFLDVMMHFIKCTSSSKENPSLLIYDNHESHLSLPVLDMAKENGVTILTLHPHCSHKMQPLDVSIFGPFKTYYSAAMDSMMMAKPGVPITIYDIAKLVNTAHQRAMTPSNIISGFRKTGIFPYDNEIFQDDDFLASYVTDRPNPIQSTDQQSVTDSQITSEEAVNCSASSVVHQVSPTSASLNVSVSTEVAAIASTCGLAPVSSFIPPQDIKGYPKAQPRKQIGQQKRKRRSMIATDTPEKDPLHSKTTAIPEKSHCRITFGKAPIERCSHSPPQELHLSDHSSDEFDEEDFLGAEEFTPLLIPPVLNDYVLVEFDTSPKTYYVGFITKPQDEDGEYEVSYLRRREKSFQFHFPAVKDFATVKLSDIKVILSQVIMRGTTKRQNSYLQFSYNFSNIIVR